MSKEICLPLSGAELVIAQTEHGYRFAIRQDGCKETQVFTLKEHAHDSYGGPLYRLELSINRDYDDTTRTYKADLLDQAGRPCVVRRDGGPRSLYSTKCRCWVPDTANSEMRKEGCFAHSHICGIRSQDEIYEDEQTGCM